MDKKSAGRINHQLGNLSVQRRAWRRRTTNAHIATSSRGISAFGSTNRVPGGGGVGAPRGPPPGRVLRRTPSPTRWLVDLGRPLWGPVVRSLGAGPRLPQWTRKRGGRVGPGEAPTTLSRSRTAPAALGSQWMEGR